ncbi:hypothetical protein ACQPWW_03695 [Micromonospora sp. CA-240977]|uniref:hypothetical protein n=1 Tax=Micromonospora sp. CA-240977 TaxID=3239957 RepID=UPI003D8FC2F1
MTTGQNLLGSRLSNRILESVWNSGHIAKIEIVWEESLAFEGRANYYDGVGALKDMLQNHHPAGSTGPAVRSDESLRELHSLDLGLQQHVSDLRGRARAAGRSRTGGAGRCRGRARSPVRPGRWLR